MHILRFTIFVLLFSLDSKSQAEMVIDFNELPLGSTSSTGSFFDGYGEFAPTGSWSSKGVTFQTNAYGPGWSYSNMNNTSERFLGYGADPKYFAQFSTFAGTGFGGAGNYALAAGSFPNDVYIDLPADQKIDSLRISNATYPAISMRDGDPPPFIFAKKFGGVSGNDPDFFKVTFTGFTNSGATGSVTGSTEFYLADYRFANNALDYVVNDWQLLDLTTLGNAASVGLTFDSSDTAVIMGTTYLNTPSFVAIDNLILSSVPEPGSLSLLLSIGLFGLFRNARRRHRKSS